MNLQNEKPVRLIVSDVDGTLVNTKKSITDENVAAIKLAMDQGVRVAIASGRAWNEMNEIFDKIPNLRYFICSNGALVMDKQDNRQVYREGFPKQQALHLLDRLLEYGIYTEATWVLRFMVLVKVCRAWIIIFVKIFVSLFSKRVPL